MTAAQLLGLFGVWAIAVISPGPDVVVVLQRALAGRRQGLATALGIVTGLSVWLAAAFAGVATLVRVYPQVMTGLQGAGGILLAALGLLGLRGWWESRAGRADDAGHPASTPPQAPPRADFTRGVVTNLANPKALVFFGAVLIPFLRGGSPVAASVVIVAGMIVVALVWFGGLALVASHRVVNERMERLLPWIDVVASVLFVGVGVAFVIGALSRVGAG